MSEEKKSFQDYFAEGMESLAQTAFPQLSKFMDFSREKAKEEDSSSEKVSDQEESDRPKSRRRRASYNTVANEMVLDALGAIDERLKVQSIVLVSSLEQQTLTNQLLNRITSGGSGGGGLFGGGGNNGGGGGIIDDAVAAVGGLSIGNFIKSLGKKLLSGKIFGPAAVAGVEGAAAIATGAINARVSDNVTKMAAQEKKEQDEGSVAGDILSGGSGMTPEEKEANKKRIAEIDNNIKEYQADLARLENHLKLNNETEENKKKLNEEELYLQKQINDLKKEKVEVLKKEKELESLKIHEATQNNSDPFGYSLKPIEKPDNSASVKGSNAPDSSVSVKGADGGNVPIVTDGHAHFGTPIPKGVTAPAHIARGIGHPVGGNKPAQPHPAGPGGYRSSPSYANLPKAEEGTARRKAEDYLGRGMSDEEWDQLQRATIAESDGKDPREDAAITASILNRAKKNGTSIVDELHKKNQFASVTGVHGVESPNFTNAGRNKRRMGQVSDAMNHYLKDIPHNQTDFTANNPNAYHGEAGTNIGYRNKMIAQGGTVFGGTIFRSHMNLKGVNDSNVQYAKNDDSPKSKTSSINDADIDTNPDDLAYEKQKTSTSTVDKPQVTALPNDVNKLVDKNYAQRKGAYNSDVPAIRDMGINAHYNEMLRSRENRKNINEATAANVTDALIKKTTEDVIHDKLESRRPAMVHQISKTDGVSSDLTSKEKSGRLSRKEVGDANPPSSRLKELFSSDVNSKDF